ncbi:hypothetical protein AB0K18_05375 [Nonomuraea sp. NPDC049421]|uniref:hypothetical protein n=1 Tax=Nonomuraea sp. NPDC049421 TaxID=3155275 RepID=UPI00342ACF13
MVSGQTITVDGSPVAAVDERFAARVMIAAPGRGEDMNGPAAQPYAALTTTGFSGMTPKVLAVVGRACPVHVAEPVTNREAPPPEPRLA